jgi:hypothetical protein
MYELDEGKRNLERCSLANVAHITPHKTALEAADIVDNEHTTALDAVNKTSPKLIPDFKACTKLL